MPVSSPQYPVNLVLAGRPCLVVGGGRVAARKLEGLVACGAVVHVVAPRVDDTVRAQRVTWEERAYRAADIAGRRLVITATDDPAVNQAVFDDCEAAGIWVNSADDPDRCTFTLPAVVRRGPVLVTASTGGHSPALASWLRGRLEQEIGEEYAVLAGLLAEERAALRAAGRSTEGLAWQTALDSDMLALIRGGHISEARERLQTCLSSS
jgi:siroheme synthase-like protein